MKSIYLDWTSNTNQHRVSEEDYWGKVRPLVMHLRRCDTCDQYFEPTADPPRPCVGIRICMVCLLKKHPGYRFLEVKSVDDDGEATYAFIDEHGNVYTSHENHSYDLSEDISYTLKQNGFLNVPTHHTPFKSTEPVKLWTSTFRVYGDVVKNSVVVLDYDDTSAKHHFTFLLYKYGSYKELTRRGEGKALYERAVALIEKTKRGGYYYIDGEKQSRIWDSDIYKVISKMESAMYDLSLQFSPPVMEEVVEPEDLPAENIIGELNFNDAPAQQTEEDVVEVQPIDETLQEPQTTPDSIVEEESIGDIDVPDNSDTRNDADTKSKRKRGSLSIVPKE